MAYDEILAGRIRELLAEEPEVTEQKMFGGLAFLAGGRMAVAAVGRGGLMVRVEPGDTDALVARTGVAPFEMRGRPLDGWVLVEAGAVEGRDELAGWVARGLSYARGLPPKG